MNWRRTGEYWRTNQLAGPQVSPVSSLSSPSIGTESGVEKTGPAFFAIVPTARKARVPQPVTMIANPTSPAAGK
jgi:hypothetical protein